MRLPKKRQRECCKISVVRKEAAEIAVKAAREVIASVMTEEKDKSLIDHAIAEVPKMLAKDQYNA